MCSRRDLLKLAASAAALGLVSGVATGQTDPRNLRPQVGDRFVYSTGPKKGTPIGPGDLALGGPHVSAYAQQPASGVIRDGSRLNEVLLVRLDSKDLTDTARANAPQGYVAFSAICTHGACSDWSWDRERKILHCPCHESEFDPKDDARVLVGPATRRLPRLPVKADDSALVVAGAFVGRVGGDLT
jgi:nitrite reductase/ring-hydroxylating ferredoxin subunit